MKFKASARFNSTKTQHHFSYFALCTNEQKCMGLEAIKNTTHSLSNSLIYVMLITCSTSSATSLPPPPATLQTQTCVYNNHDRSTYQSIKPSHSLVGIMLSVYDLCCAPLETTPIHLPHHGLSLNGEYLRLIFRECISDDVKRSLSRCVLCVKELTTHDAR